MKNKYEQICKVELDHDFYVSQKCEEGVLVHPTPDCIKIMQDHNIIFKNSSTGFVLYGVLDILKNLSRKLRFWLEIIDPYFMNYTVCHNYRGAKNVFYFSNLEDKFSFPEGEGDTLEQYLIDIVSKPYYTHRFKRNHDFISVQVFDSSGLVIHSSIHRGVEANSEVRFDFNIPPEVQSSCCKIKFKEDPDRDHVEEIHFYYGKNIKGYSPLCLFELSILEAVEKLYSIKFQSRATTWRYILRQENLAGPFPLDDLEILDCGPMMFNKMEKKTEVVFDSLDPRKFSEIYDGFNASVGVNQPDSSGKKRLCKLPVPKINSQLQCGEEGKFVSEVYVYL